MRLVKLFLVSILCFSSNLFAEAKIDGLWKHSQKPAWLEIKFESGVGALTVKRHDDNVKAEGLNVIKGIQPDIAHVNQWSAQMYSAADNAYVGVILILINSTTITVYERGDVNKTNEILRIARE